MVMKFSCFFLFKSEKGIGAESEEKRQFLGTASLLL